MAARFLVTALMASAALAVCAAKAEAGGAPCVGECYERVSTPPVYGTVAEQVMVAPARTIARPVSAEFAVVPRTVTVAPEHVVARHVPAKVGLVSETVMVSPGGKRWVVKRDHHGRMIGCWEIVPAQYATRQRAVVVRPAAVMYQRVPAVTEVRAQHVMVRPPSVSYETIPAAYATRERTVMVSPGAEAWRPIRGHRRGH